MEDVQVFYKIPDRFVPWPKISKIPKENSSDMYASFTCHPPLGQGTVVSAKDDFITFRVALEAEKNSKENWELSLWHELDSHSEWKEDAFRRTDSASSVVSCSFFL
jgi:hypothetical protein